LSNSGIKLAVSLVILLLGGAAAPLAANALMPNNSVSDGMFLPVPRQLSPTSYHSPSQSMPDPNSIQVPLSSNLITSPIQHQLLSTSQPSSVNTSISNPNSATSSSRNGSDSYYYNNSGAWPNRTPFGLLNAISAVAHFLNIPKNLIVPPLCQLEVCPTIVGTQRGDIIIATAVNNARIFGLGGNDIIECGLGNCNVFTAFGNNVLMSGPSFSAHLFAGSGGFFRPGNNIFIGGGGETLMVGGNGNDQFFAGSNNLFDGGGDIMIGGSGANYFDCGSNGNGIILDFNPAKGDTKAPNCRYVITTYQNNIFGPGVPDNITGIFGNQGGQNSNANGLLGFLLGQGSNANQPNNSTGPTGLQSGQGSNANQANNGGLTGGASIPGPPSGQNLNANQANNGGLTGDLGNPSLMSGQGSNANQPNIAAIMGLLSGHGSNANQANNPGLTGGASIPGLLSGHNLSSKPNYAAIMGWLSGHNSNANQPNNAGMATAAGSGNPGVMTKGYPS
jgi:hypothetical protein